MDISWWTFAFFIPGNSVTSEELVKFDSFGGVSTVLYCWNVAATRFGGNMFLEKISWKRGKKARDMRT